jgi:hypothetical protein
MLDYLLADDLVSAASTHSWQGRSRLAPVSESIGVWGEAPMQAVAVEDDELSPRQ